jgi:hypothetical protein
MLWNLFTHEKENRDSWKEFVDFVADYYGIELVEMDKEWIDGDTFPTSFQEFTRLLEQQFPIPENFTDLLSKDQRDLLGGASNDSLISRLLLYSSNNSLRLPDIDRHVYQDMKMPFSKYLINASHNTYLNGDQVSCAASADNYRIALEQGFKCLEIDLWDGPKKTNSNLEENSDIENQNHHPKVYHGYTLTDNDLYLGDVLKVIKEHAFCRSEFPVFLAVELRCSLSHQEAAVKIIQEELGEMLLPPFNSADEFSKLSPDTLKGKILLMITGPDMQASSTTLHFAPNLLRIAHLIEKQKFHDSEIFANLGFHNLVPFDNLSETTCNKNHENILANSSHQIYRIFPRGTRVDSSNLDPIGPWRNGSQFVTMNRQVLDLPMRLNISKFKDNGSCGYLLKPEDFKDPSNFWSLKLISPEKFETNPGFFHVNLLLSGHKRFKKSGHLHSSKKYIDPKRKHALSRACTIDPSSAFFQIAYFESLKKLKSRHGMFKAAANIDEHIDEDAVLNHTKLISEHLVPLHQCRTGVRSVILHNPFSGNKMHRLLVYLSNIE